MVLGLPSRFQSVSKLLGKNYFFNNHPAPKNDLFIGKKMDRNWREKTIKVTWVNVIMEVEIRNA